MKAYVAEAFGPPETLVLKDVIAADVPPGYVRLSVKAAGASLLDALIAGGKYQVKPPLPFSPGSEFAGVVDAVADDVTMLKPGDRVMAGGFVGGFSETALVPAVAAVRIPATMTFETAAGFRTNYMTALHALRQRANLQPGETFLVLGAAGGVGSAAIEIAKIMGARVIAVASSEEKRAFAMHLGADHAIGVEPEAFRDQIKALTDGRGVDVVYDPVGGSLAEAALRGTAWQGRYLVVGFASGEIPKIPLNLVLLKGCQIVGVFWGAFMMREPARNRRHAEQIFAWVAEGKLRPAIDAVLPFAEAPAALVRLEQRQVKGKLVLRP